jgi:hypothetical protein
MHTRKDSDSPIRPRMRSLSGNRSTRRHPTVPLIWSALRALAEGWWPQRPDIDTRWLLHDPSRQKETSTIAGIGFGSVDDQIARGVGVGGTHERQTRVKRHSGRPPARCNQTCKQDEE